MCVEKMRQNIVPQFQWIEKYKGQVEGAAFGQSSSQDPFGLSTFYTPSPAALSIDSKPGKDLDPFADFVNERQSVRSNNYVNTTDKNGGLVSSHSSPALHSSTSVNRSATNNQHNYVNCPKDPGLLMDLQGNIITSPTIGHPAPPPNLQTGKSINIATLKEHVALYRSCWSLKGVFNHLL